MTHQFHPTSLREYDIRGVIGETLGADDARAIGRGFATLLRRAGGTRVAVGWDGRDSSPMLAEALVDGLAASGVDVVRVGLGATPMLYYAEAMLEVDGGIMITGSHNPPSYNGFKMVFQHRPFFGADIQTIGQLAADGDWEEAETPGQVTDFDILDQYVERLFAGYQGGDFRIAIFGMRQRELAEERGIAVADRAAQPFQRIDRRRPVVRGELPARGEAAGGDIGRILRQEQGERVLRLIAMAGAVEGLDEAEHRRFVEIEVGGAAISGGRLGETAERP